MVNISELAVTHCGICSDLYENGDEVKCYGCNHYAHSSCFEQWLQVRMVCPTCNQEIESDDDSNTAPIEGVVPGGGDPDAIEDDEAIARNEQTLIQLRAAALQAETDAKAFESCPLCNIHFPRFHTWLSWVARCGHFYHSHCMDELKKGARRCLIPKCRDDPPFKVFADETEEEEKGDVKYVLRIVPDQEIGDEEEIGAAEDENFGAEDEEENFGEYDEDDVNSDSDASVSSNSDQINQFLFIFFILFISFICFIFFIV